jgi:hypothetical protein
MYVFYAIFDDEIALCDIGIDAAQFGAKRVQFVATEQPDTFEHRNMG